MGRVLCLNHNSSIAKDVPTLNQLEFTDGLSPGQLCGFDSITLSPLELRNSMVEELSLDGQSTETNEESYQSFVSSTTGSTFSIMKDEADRVRRFSYSNDVISSPNQLKSILSPSPTMLCGIDSNIFSSQVPNDLVCGTDNSLTENSTGVQSHNIGKRNTTVTFQSPPVTSVRNIPRVSQSDIPSLFFNEQEISQIENDI